MTHIEISTTEAATAPTPWHLQGNFAPVRDELDVSGLEVIGGLPEGLAGTYVRNGFNPRSGFSPHWFFGHGMLHAVDLDGEGGARYRNRYVDTPFKDHDGTGLDWVLDPACSPANTHIVRHNGRWLALEEVHQPYALDDHLDTLGVEDFGGAVTTSFTAHPKLCPVTGELLAFGYSVVTTPYLTYFRIGPTGEVLAVEPIEIPNPVMMHDWNVTEHHVVFMDLPVRFGLERAMAGDQPFGWHPESGARLGVMPRNGTNADVTWHEIDPCYVFHPLNAYEDGDRIELLVCRQDRAMAGGFDDIESARAHLWRWSIDQRTGTVTETQLDDRIADFPRVDDRLVGHQQPLRLPHRDPRGAGDRRGDRLRALQVRPADRKGRDPHHQRHHPTRRAGVRPRRPGRRRGRGLGPRVRHRRGRRDHRTAGHRGPGLHRRARGPGRPPPAGALRRPRELAPRWLIGHHHQADRPPTRGRPDAEAARRVRRRQGRRARRRR